MDSMEAGLCPEEELDQKRLKNRVAVLRVFNYYRVGLSFALLLLFLQVPGQQLVGKENPEIFQLVILSYIGVNILVSFFALIARVEFVSKTTSMLTILVMDIIFLSLLMYSSGGVSSGLGNFLVFPVAYAGVLILGRISIFVAAIAVILALYCELNLFFMRGAEDYASFFKIGLLGGALFAVNILFQYVSRQLRRKEQEVTTLEQLNLMSKKVEEAQHDLEDSNARFELLLNSAGEAVLGLDLDGEITFANPKAHSLLEIDDSLVGASILEFLPDDSERNNERDGSQQDMNIVNYLQVNSRGEGETGQWRTSSGKEFIVEYTCESTSSDGTSTGVVVVFQDITDRKEIEEQLNFLANFDSLTSLANRASFQSNLEKSLARSKRSGAQLAVMLLDLDHFKYVNDKYGHDIGDALLTEVSVRLKKCIRLGDSAARLGGDEFAILLLDFHTPDNVALVAKNIVEEVAKPYKLNGQYLNISTSIGISVFDQGEMTSGELIKSADTAMYESKHRGRNRFSFFQEEMQIKAEERQQLLMSLQQAIAKNEFKMLYQPIYSLYEGTIVSSEALIRWRLDSGESIGPNVFIPLAEENGKIEEIGDWVLRSVFEQIDTWHSHLGIYPRVAINISSRQLRTDHFRKQIEMHLKSFGVPAEVLHLELLETGVMEDSERMLYELNLLHNLGIKLSIDDFGTGYSSIDYLRRLPIDIVKIDKTFVHGIGINKHDEEIVRVIIAMAHTMGIKVIAEGIENAEQKEFLISNGCDMGQGYLFSIEMGPYEFTEHLKEKQLILMDGSIPMIINASTNLQ